MKRTAVVLCSLIMMSLAALAAARAEKIGSFTGEASEKVEAALAPDGYRVFLPNTLAACDIWLVREVPAIQPASAGKESGVNYPKLVQGQFLGVITFPKGGGADFRGQPIRAGSYTMRYALLPNDGNHLGAAPNPDMVLLIPIAEDADPGVNFDFAKLVELSVKASRTGHPAAFEMMPPEDGGASVTQTDDGWIVFHATTQMQGKPLPIAIVVKGSAAQ